jgi:hypothetical protein
VRLDSDRKWSASSTTPSIECYSSDGLRLAELSQSTSISMALPHGTLHSQINLRALGAGSSAPHRKEG